jgi:hypothetical protein
LIKPLYSSAWQIGCISCIYNEFVVISEDLGFRFIEIIICQGPRGRSGGVCVSCSCHLRLNSVFPNIKIHT